MPAIVVHGRRSGGCASAPTPVRFFRIDPQPRAAQGEHRRHDMTARASESCAVGGWEKWHDWQAEPMRPVVDWYCTAIGARPGMRVLDAACGTGLPSLAIATGVGP